MSALRLFSASALVGLSQAQQTFWKGGTGTTVLFYSANTDGGSDYPQTSSTDASSVKWELKIVSYQDADTGLEYMEMVNTLTAPILSSDEVLFHLEFTTPNKLASLERDAMECAMTRQDYNGYWAVTATDKNITLDDNGDDVEADDSNFSIASEGQDWFVYQEDAERDDGDNLCTASSTSGIQCSVIRCIAWRLHDTSDTSDAPIEATASTPDTMTVPAIKSYIVLNKSDHDDTTMQVLQTIADATISVKQSALSGLSTVSAAAVLALTAALF